MVNYDSRWGLIPNKRGDIYLYMNITTTNPTASHHEKMIKSSTMAEALRSLLDKNKLKYKAAYYWGHVNGSMGSMKMKGKRSMEVFVQK